MDKQKFDMYWKIALMVILVAGILYMFYEWHNIDKEAMQCKSNPFEWGKLKAQEQGISCYYSCSKGNANEMNYTIP